MKLTIFTLLVAATTLSRISDAQDMPIPISQGKQLKTLFLNKDGKVLFTLPPDHSVVSEFPSGGYIIMVDDPVNIDVFSEGRCVVKNANNEFYWIDEKGKTVKSFGKQYEKMSPFMNGYCLVWKKMTTRDDAYMLVYLNPQGNNAFGVKEFWEAAPFSEGYAAVQLVDEKGEWGFIDKTGEMVIHLDSRIVGEIVKLGPFSEGLARVFVRGEKTGDYQYKYNYYFVDTNGKIAIDLAKIFPGQVIGNVQSFSDGLCSVTFSKPNGGWPKLVFIDKNGNVRHSFNSIDSHTSFKGGVMSYTTAKKNEDGSFSMKMHIIDTVENEIILTTASDEPLIEMKDISHDYYNVQAINPESLLTILFARKTGKQVFKTKHKIVGNVGNIFLLRDEITETFHLIRLPEGQEIWHTADENRYFISIEEAKKLKNKVHYFKLRSGDSFPAEILSFKNLESLDIMNDLKEIPSSISGLKKLRVLQFSFLSGLKSLPIEIASLPLLEELHIMDCKSLHGVERIIESAPSLKTVYLSDYELEAGFEEKMKKLKPGLTIYSSFSTLEEVIMEE
jgi:hypothetical protein